MRPFVGPVLAAAVALSGSGCAIARIGAKNMTTLFASPAPSKKAKPVVAADARLAVVWVGHATALVQIGDKVVLTDPVFTSTVGQLSKRLVEPGVDVADLPPIDAVLVSHLHYDHLSLGSLEMIEPKVRQLLLPPTGLRYLTDFRFPAVELGPWRSWEKDGLRVTAVPVHHVGFRYGVDRGQMTEGFTGYVVERDGIKVWFGGDTAYDQQLFVQTAQRFPGIDLALVPIAPIEPHDFMRATHVDAHEAVAAFFDLGARWMVPVHFDTFVNSADAPGDARRALARASARWRLGGRAVMPLAIGERRVLVARGASVPDAPLDPPVQAPAAPPEKTPEPSRADDVPDDDRLD